MIEFLTRVILMFPSWPVLAAWIGVVLACAAVGYCRWRGYHVVIYLDGAILVGVAAVWVVVVYAAITFYDVPVVLRVSPVRIAWFCAGLSLVHLLRDAIEETLKQAGRGLHRRLHRGY